MADAVSTPKPAAPASASGQDSLAETVVPLRRAVQERADALNDWAHDQARALTTTAKQKPLAAAGVSAGVAFAAGLVLGFLLAQAAPEPEPTWKDRLRQLKTPW